MPPADRQHPNVLCFITDQHRADHIGCAGNPLIQTPNLDRLAESGVRFERAYVHHPICSPSRATLWTGLGVRAHRVRANGMSLDPRIPTIVSALAEVGYRTHGVGKFHLTPFSARNGADLNGLKPEEWPETRQMWLNGRIGQLPVPYYGLQSAHLVCGHGDFFWGEYRNWLLHEMPEAVAAIEQFRKEKGEGWQTTFKSHVPFELHHSHWIADHVIDFLREQSQTRQPFFCWCSFPDPHHPYHAPDPYFSLYDPAEMPTPARREGELADLPPHFTRVQTEPYRVVGMPTPLSRWYDTTPTIMARTYAMVSNMDANIGRVLDALEGLGLRDNTIVIYLSDHGDMMGDHWLQQKGPFHFGGLIRVPFIWSWPGHIPAGRVYNGVASLLDFAPTILDLCGVPIPVHPDAEKPLHPNAPPPWPGHSLRPLLEGGDADTRESAFIDQDDDASGLRLRTLVTERYRFTWYVGQPYGELFDLQEDPQELRNLWNDPGYRSVRSDLTAALLDQVCMHDYSLPRMLGGA